jgi:hypothetical protein
MADLKTSVKELVTAATSEVNPKALRTKVEAVLAAFDEAEPKPRAAAVKAIGAALGKVEGRGGQVLALALGALVEGGASAKDAWPAASKGLAAILEQATAFAHAAVATSGEEELERALEKSGAAVAAKMPAEGAAWKAVPARCLAAVACLTRSKEARALARDEGEIADAAWSLSDAISEVGALLAAIEVLDDATLLVVDGKKGWKVQVDGLSTNAELYLLLADLLEKKVDAKVLAAVRSGETPKKKSVVVPFTLGLDPEDAPADIPLHGKSKYRVVRLAAGATTIDLTHLPVLDGLVPHAEVVAPLPAATLTKLTRRSS